MSEIPAPVENPDGSGFYEIRIKGHLAERWAEGFEGLSFTHESDGTTRLSGPIADQAALHGVLKRIRDLGLPLVEVFQSKPEQKDKPNTQT